MASYVLTCRGTHSSPGSGPPPYQLSSFFLFYSEHTQGAIFKKLKVVVLCIKTILVVMEEGQV